MASAIDASGSLPMSSAETTSTIELSFFLTLIESWMLLRMPVTTTSWTSSASVPAAWSCVLAGGGIKGGQAFGKTSESGEEVEEGKVDVGDVLATLCTALKIDPEAKNVSDQGRPIKLAEGKAIKDVLA